MAQTMDSIVETLDMPLIIPLAPEGDDSATNLETFPTAPAPACFQVPDVEELSIDQVHVNYLRRAYTSRSLVEGFLTRIRALDQDGPKLNSIVTVSPTVLREAEELDAVFAKTSRFVGPLHGIPVVVKDQFDTAGLRTSYGSVTASDNVPDRDAEVVRRLKEAGALILAKTTMPDWATSFYSTSSVSGITRNPYDLSRDTGGSSSGTAAAVAASLAVVGVGGDTAGSIRLPCSWCSLVGLKCTPGLVDCSGASPLIGAFDSAGPMARSVKDAAIMLDVISEQRAPLAQGYASHLDAQRLRHARLGVLTSAFGDDADPPSRDVNRVLWTALDKVQQAGCTLVPVNLPTLNDKLNLTPGLYETSRAALDGFMAQRPALRGMTCSKLVSDHLFHPACDLIRTIASISPAGSQILPEEGGPTPTPAHDLGPLQQVLLEAMERESLAALVYPVAQIPAVKHAQALAGSLETFVLPTNTFLAAQASLPAITVPAGSTRTTSSSGEGEGGLPVGIEMLGRQFSEQVLLDLAYGFECVVKGRTTPKFIGS
ncbi:hypothetical protein AYL99_06262 [Fonsecaea erecta]|uniref:Amidase domain-containing protein n=1 Tax=Fonsecaea erecta TaxID=1367422 RepID=A0A178ZIU2_9EURO|nr:hypothetical protein AYL99_06262 [Fonsecaea erecta]OAP58965.1 hypothetical protein AYL99_06262 [Fonsecaea erecta]